MMSLPESIFLLSIGAVGLTLDRLSRRLGEGSKIDSYIPLRLDGSGNFDIGELSPVSDSANYARLFGSNGYYPDIYGEVYSSNAGLIDAFFLYDANLNFLASFEG